MAIYLIIAIVAVAVTLLIAVPVTANISVKKKTEKDAETIGTAEVKARSIIDEALKTAETKKREALLEAKEESIKTKNELDKETKERRAELQRYERRVLSKEENLDKKAEAMEKREAGIASREEALNRKNAEVEALHEKGMQELEKSRRKKDCVQQFCDASQTFFHQRLKAFTPQPRRQKLRQGMIITEIERQNLQILSESCQICDILPAGIRSKTGLPVISDTKRDLVKMAIESI